MVPKTNLMEDDNEREAVLQNFKHQRNDTI